MTPKSIAFLLTLVLIVSGAVRAEELSGPAQRASIRTQLAAEYFKRGQYSTALDEIQKALAADPKYASAYSVAGLIYSELKEAAPARKNFLEALRLTPDDPDINHNYGWFLCQQGQYKEGVAYYMKAVQNPLYETPDRSLVNAGQCTAKSGDLDGGRDYLLRALRLRPSSLTARIELVELDLKRKDFVEAKRYLIESQKLTQPSAQMAWLAVRVEHALGNQDNEARYADLLRKQYPDSLETARLLTNQYDAPAE
ncbi:type IV pilus biogenesis/stability protein PilW [Andreprevotia chitinilytica]|uniref:type IV pilus biogenesis/stability protein PilW n=1 Tax=Andreprevotia chitinilytica TaxID=396808 RepID=UPI00054CF321|nr:type IV pilus biogenesis/stability protein PilW [Andreprevotia chitinilytica]